MKVAVSTEEKGRKPHRPSEKVAHEAPVESVGPVSPDPDDRDQFLLHSPNILEGVSIHFYYYFNFVRLFPSRILSY